MRSSMYSIQLALYGSSDVVGRPTILAESAIQKATKFHHPHFLRSGGTVYRVSRLTISGRARE